VGNWEWGWTKTEKQSNVVIGEETRGRSERGEDLWAVQQKPSSQKRSDNKGHSTHTNTHTHTHTQC